MNPNSDRSTVFGSWLHLHFLTIDARRHEPSRPISIQIQCPDKIGKMPITKGIEAVTDANYNRHSAIIR